MKKNASRNFSHRRLIIWVLSSAMLVTLCACSSLEVYLRNPDLKTIKPDYPGHRLHKGQFTEPYMSNISNSPWPLLRWSLTPNLKKKAKQREYYALVVRPITVFPDPRRDYLIWFGHAAFLLHVNGQTLLTDPCLTAPPMMKRKAPLPVPISNLTPDYILISHGHYDHLDQTTLAQLNGNSLTALVPLKTGALVTKANPAIRIQEAGWYQQFQTPDIRITFLPAKHWNRRTPFDFNHTLWGSFLIQWKNKTLYFSGDTGYAGHFKEIAALVGQPIDYALLPIAAYDPAFIMQSSHLNPEEAIQAFHDLGAHYLIPMHYGTFDLSDEPLGEPIQRFNEAIQKEGLRPNTLIPDVGEIVFLD